MADYKRTEVPEDVILHISPSRNTVVVQEHSANGVVCLCPRGTSRADAGYAALSCEAHDPQAGYRGVLCTGVL